MANWSKRFIDLARHISSWSKDRSTKVGAVIVDQDNRVVSFGYNGFPSGFDDTIEERHERPVKYDYTEHAERNAIYNAARVGVSTKGCTIYLHWFPCHECSRAIIQSGISKIVCVKPSDTESDKWKRSFELASQILKEGGVEVELFEETKE